MTAASPNRVWVHARASIADLKEEEPLVQAAIREALGVTDEGRHQVRISGSTGWIEYVDRHEVFERREIPRILMEAGDAARRAEAFIASMKATLGRAAANRRAQKVSSMLLFPSLARPQIHLVARNDGSGWDHWLYRSQPQIPLWVAEASHGSPLVDVVWSQFEIRVGHGGRVIAWHSRWAPLSGERIETTLTKPVKIGQSTGHAATPHEHEGHEHGADGPANASAPTEIVYVADGDGIAQYYLSPYYRLVHGNHARFMSACAYSLTIDFGLRAHATGATAVSAVVNGGSGDYDFHWAMTPIDSVWEGGIQDLGGGKRESVTLRKDDAMIVGSVTIPAGAWVVLVNVRDRRTGAFKQHQQAVYGFPILIESTPALV